LLDPIRGSLTPKGVATMASTTTTRPFFFSAAEEAGHEAGLVVLAGTLSVEEVGDLWLAHADRSYAAGRSFERAYDATGADR
jgi:hypothetical protein